MKITDGRSLKRALILALIMFIAMVNHYVFKTGVNAIVVKTFGALKIPWIELCDALLSILVVFLLVNIKKIRARFSSYIIWLSIILSTTLIALGWVWNIYTKTDTVLFLIGLAGNMLVFAATYCIWMLLTSTAFMKSWLTITLVGLGAQLGVFVGAAIAKNMALQGHINKLPILIGAIYICLFPFISSCIRKFSCGGVEEQENTGSSPKESATRSVIPGSYFIFSILLLVLLGGIYGRAVNWRIQQFADYRTSIINASTFLGDYYQTMSVLSILFQIFITPIVLRKIPNVIGLVFQPIFGILIAVLAIWKNDVLLCLNCMLVFTCSDYTIYNAFKERLWVHLTLAQKVYHKSFAALLIPKIAGVVNALSVLVFSNSIGIFWIVFTLVIGILWTITAILVAKVANTNKKIPITVFKSSIDKI
ncbi:hypothetical protein [Nemorincola caseinilytica]|uniref:hypothetical protein n=1 Tax=Nemorincola caseinilytica TaxID=2054315 RepID=UPI0031F0D13A